MRIELDDVIKSRDVEDPVNLHLHRPLQLFLVRRLVRTAITPNQITLLALLCGLGSAACILVGTRVSLVGAAALLFASAILDGCDGMVARLKKSSSETGHALDGAADFTVNIATTGAAVWHIGQATGHPLLALALGVAAHLAGANHLMLYDFHCAMYLRFLTGGGHRGGDRSRAAETLAGMRARRAPAWQIAVMRIFVWQLGNRDRLIQTVNPRALALYERPTTGAFAETYVATHRAPMRLWALLGNAPHMDLLALALAFDRPHWYFGARIVVFSLLGVAAAVWERRVTRAQLEGDRPAGAPA